MKKRKKKHRIVVRPGIETVEQLDRRHTEASDLDAADMDAAEKRYRELFPNKHPDAPDYINDFLGWVRETYGPDYAARASQFDDQDVDAMLRYLGIDADESWNRMVDKLLWKGVIKPGDMFYAPIKPRTKG